jgi:hypothetical protein
MSIVATVNEELTALSLTTIAAVLLLLSAVELLDIELEIFPITVVTFAFGISWVPFINTVLFPGGSTVTSTAAEAFWVGALESLAASETL